MPKTMTDAEQRQVLEHAFTSKFLRDSSLVISKLNLDRFIAELEAARDICPAPDLSQHTAAINQIDFMRSVALAAQDFQRAIRQAEERYEQAEQR